MKPNLPKKWRKDMQPYKRCSVALYDDLHRRLHQSIKDAEERLQEPLDAHTRECWEDRHREYFKGLERLEQMRKDGLFVSEALCRGANGWFDWKSYLAAQVASLEMEKDKLQTMLDTATDDKQRSAAQAAIDRVQFRIDNITTKTLTPAQKQSVIARVLKEKQQ